MNTMNKIAILALLALLVATPFAQAKEVTFRFTATITSVLNNLSVAGVQVGDQYEGSYTFEDTTPGVPRGTLGADHFDAITDLQISIGNFEVGLDRSGLGNRNNIRVNEEGSNPPRDLYQVLASVAAIEFCLAEQDFNFLLIDIQGLSPSNLINGSSLPTTPPDLSLANVRRNIVLASQVCVGNTRDFVVIQGVILSLELAVVVDVGIDIKPGSFPNSINLGSGGATPVAILGSASLNVNDIDTDTLTLGTFGVKTVGKKDKQLCSVDDVSGDFTGGPQGAPDGFSDLVCHFVTISIVPEAGDTQAKLSGALFDGTLIKGTDSVNIVP